MLKIIKQYAYKISEREYYNELYVALDDIPSFEYALMVDEIVENIISNIEKYLNEPINFKLNNNFKIILIVINNLNNSNDIGIGYYSLSCYNIIPNKWKYIFEYETAGGDGTIKLNDFSETYPENSLDIKNIVDHGLCTLTDFIYIENEIFKLDRYKMIIFLKGLFYSREVHT